MLTARPETYVYMLLEFLSVVGEYPTASLALLGNERPLKALIHRCESEQKIRLSSQGRSYSIRLFSISGHGKQKTLRLHKDALTLVGELDPQALAAYMSAFREHRFTGNELNIDRNHRIAEATAMCFRAGAEYKPYKLPVLQTDSIARVIGDKLLFYPSRSVKRTGDDDMNKIGFSRMAGLLFTPNRPFAVYNARSSVMKWSGTGEFKTFHHLLEVVRRNSSAAVLDSAILFSNSGHTAIATLMETNKPNRLDMPFSQIYSSIHYIPLDENGIRLLRLFAQKNFKERLLAALIPDTIRARGRHLSCDCDGEANGHYILSHLDGDIARLIDFTRSSETMPERFSFEVVCYPWQVDYVSELTGGNIKITAIAMQAIEEALDKPPKGGNSG